jgi:FtsZ-interacting cell division protein ZipA
MEEVLIEIASESPIIGFLVYVWWTERRDKNALMDRTDKRQEQQNADDKALWEKVLTTMTEVTSVLKATQGDHTTIKTELNTMGKAIALINQKLKIDE